MTCQECELRLGLDENVWDENVGEHLTICAQCRALAGEMRSNADAFELMASDRMPAVRHRVMSEIRAQAGARRVMRWGWALAAAAMLVAAIFVGTRSHPAAPVREPIREIAAAPPAPAPIQLPPRTAAARPKAAEVLKVKMLTDDPDVVIYWLIDKKEGAE